MLLHLEIVLLDLLQDCLHVWLADMDGLFLLFERRSLDRRLSLAKFEKLLLLLLLLLEVSAQLFLDNQEGCVAAIFHTVSVFLRNFQAFLCFNLLILLEFPCIIYLLQLLLDL